MYKYSVILSSKNTKAVKYKEELAKLHNLLFIDINNKTKELGSKESIDPTLTDPWEWGDNMKYIIATKNNKLVGFVSVVISEVGTYMNVIGNLYIAEDHRQKGIAKHLMMLAINLTSILNKDTDLYLTTSINNYQAIKLYRSLGFITEEVLMYIRK